MRKQKYTLLIFGEGGHEEKFYKVFTKSPNFMYHIESLNFNFPQFSHASGSSAETILNQCRIKNNSDGKYDLVLCFIDIDDLKNDFPKNWRKKKENLIIRAEKNDIFIIWQDESFEDEVCKINPKLKKIKKLKNKKWKEKINKWAIKNVNKFINKDLDKKIKRIIKKRVDELNKK